MYASRQVNWRPKGKRNFTSLFFFNLKSFECNFSKNPILKFEEHILTSLERKQSCVIPSAISPIVPEDDCPYNLAYESLSDFQLPYLQTTLIL
jgi:hypothetical protein